MALMQQTVLAPIRILVLAAASGMIPGFGSGHPIDVDVEHAAATPYHADDPDVAGFRVRFGIRLTNRSRAPLELPKSETGDGGMTRIAVLGLEAKRPDGRWEHVFQSSWYDTGAIKYESCRPLPPGGVAEFADLASGFLLLNRQLAGLGNEPTVRFNLVTFCRQPDGKVVTRSVTTKGFALRLPARR